MHSRRSRRRTDDATPGVDVATDSTFAKRRAATDENEKANVAPIHALSVSHIFGYVAVCVVKSFLNSKR